MGEADRFSSFPSRPSESRDPNSGMPDTIHATAISIAGAGVLLMGQSGSGKSDLALRLIDRGAILIADDRVVATRNGTALILSAPSTIAGLIEVRGVGLQQLPFVQQVKAAAVFDLDTSPERLPTPGEHVISGVRLPLFNLSPFEASAPLKVELAVAVLWQAR